MLLIIFIYKNNVSGLWINNEIWILNQKTLTKTHRDYQKLSSYISLFCTIFILLRHSLLVLWFCFFTCARNHAMNSPCTFTFASVLNWEYKGFFRSASLNFIKINCFPYWNASWTYPSDVSPQCFVMITARMTFHLIIIEQSNV